MAVVALALVTVLTALAVSDLRERASKRARVNALNDRAVVLTEKWEAEKQRANEEKGRADANERWRRTAYSLQIASAFDAYRVNHVAQANELLAQCPPDLRHWEWHYLKRVCASALLTVQFAERSRTLSFSPDGKKVARACQLRSGPPPQCGL